MKNQKKTQIINKTWKTRRETVYTQTYIHIQRKENCSNKDRLRLANFLFFPTPLALDALTPPSLSFWNLNRSSLPSWLFHSGPFEIHPFAPLISFDCLESWLQQWIWELYWCRYWDWPRQQQRPPTWFLRCTISSLFSVVVNALSALCDPMMSAVTVGFSLRSIFHWAAMAIPLIPGRSSHCTSTSILSFISDWLVQAQLPWQYFRPFLIRINPIPLKEQKDF